MPAIQLSRLKIQAAQLAEKFMDPQAFIRDLNELLDLYTNRTFRATQTARRLSLPTYHTPAPVLRQIKTELAPLATSQPAEAIRVCEALWGAATLEARLLAAYLLGCIPLPQAFPALAHLPDWLAQSTDRQVHTSLLTDALVRLRRENPDEFFLLLEGWLKSPRNSLQVWGLRALIPLLNDPGFENLPAVFRILEPAIRSAGPVTQLELQAVIATLERISLTETLVYLRQVTLQQASPLMVRTMLRILPGLSPDLQAGLRKTLRTQVSQL